MSAISEFLLLEFSAKHRYLLFNKQWKGWVWASQYDSHWFPEENEGEEEINALKLLIELGYVQVRAESSEIFRAQITSLGRNKVTYIQLCA